MKKALRSWRRHKSTDVAATCRGAKQKHTTRIAAKALNIALHPFQHRDLIKATVIARNLFRPLGVECRMREKTQYAQTQVVSYKDHTAAFDHQAAVVDDPTRRAGARQTGVSTAMQPDHDREQLGRALRRCPNVYSKTVFAANDLVAGSELRTHGPELFSRQNPLPRFGRLGRAESEITYRRLRVRNSFESANTACNCASDGTTFSADCIGNTGARASR